MTTIREHADSGWDDYAERVLRNEGRLLGLEVLVAETRESDRKLIEQRSESLARELERRAEALLELVTARADAVLALGVEERESDRTEVRLLIDGVQQRLETQIGMLREMYDTSIEKNYEQSREAIRALEQRQEGATEKLEQMVRQWRDSDREARELFATETARHLDQLNHNNERMSAFQANSVTRELWQSEKDASITREGLLRDQIIALEKTVLGMTPLVQSEKAHAEVRLLIEKSVAASAEVLSNKIGVVTEKVDDLKTFRDTTQGRSSGYSQFYGAAIAAVGLLISVIFVAVALAGR